MFLFFIIRVILFYLFRKCSTALVRLVPGVGNITVNGKDFSFYVQNNPSCCFFSFVV